MKFTLKDYQSDAVREVLQHLRKARKDWHQDGYKSAFSLTAATGAGKTVMAAAVFEALFFGDDEYDFEADPGAVVIWFSDDPSLNEQSRFRLEGSSDKLMSYNLRVIDSTFSRQKFEPGKVYFLNTQKLSKNSLLVRGSSAESDRLPGMEDDQLRLPMPDSRAFTIWDTIQNTVEDPDLTLYLLLDEAHRGMKDGNARTDGKTTIIKQLINGKDGMEGIPVVLGISATVDRFNEAVSGMQGRRSALPNVIVDSSKVQESGLLKDTITLNVPDELGDVKTVLLRKGTRELRESSEEWAKYAKDQKLSESVLPLMVLQVPNAPDHNEIGTWLQTIFEEWPDLPMNSLANVFGEHKTENFGGYEAPYIPPERVQESELIRILIAKDAISTGWDCPRAEVMVSFRAATDKTHITQLLGRMVRSPLARRIPGNDRLNSVDCLLPSFNRKTVQEVVNLLMSGGESGEDVPGRRVLVNPREMKPNPAVPEEVWNKLIMLPSQALPKRKAKPLKRLTLLAHELAGDKFLPKAGKKAHEEMHKVLDGLRERYRDELAAARDAVLEVRGTTVTADVGTATMTFSDFVEAADTAVIEDAYKRAGRLISADVSRTYAEYLAKKNSDADDEVDALIEAHTIIAAMGLVPNIKDDLEREAESLSNAWLTKYRVDFKNLNDERQDVYREISQMSAGPIEIDLARPRSGLQTSTAIREIDGAETSLPTFQKHLLCDDAGYFPAKLNDWETTVVNNELARNDYVAWYRNPGRGYESLGVTYSSERSAKIMRPDFLFFARSADGTIVADIIDPHSFHLADALSKLKGLAAYAEAHGSVFRRIEAIAVLNDTYKVLDLKEKSVRNAVLAAEDAESLYNSAAAADYVFNT